MDSHVEGPKSISMAEMIPSIINAQLLRSKVPAFRRSDPSYLGNRTSDDNHQYRPRVPLE